MLCEQCEKRIEGAVYIAKSDNCWGFSSKCQSCFNSPCRPPKKIEKSTSDEPVTPKKKKLAPKKRIYMSSDGLNAELIYLHERLAAKTHDVSENVVRVREHED
tara:strand:- start:1698 stop:2006 length:309 start_codon:yes stop_codon:yes gene_type:complete